MIDLEFSKYYDDRDTLYGPYGCTCAPRHKCPACLGHRTVQTYAYKEARRATILAQTDEPPSGPVQARQAHGPAIRSIGSRRAELRAFAARWFAEFQQLPLPSEIIALRQSLPRPTWVLSDGMIYLAYESCAAFHADCVMHGIGAPTCAQQAADRLWRLRDVARRKPKRKKV